MRKSFDTLAALVQTHLGQDALSGDLFVFRSRRGDRIKLLWWGEDGYGIWLKRLEAGSFVLPLAEKKPVSPRGHGFVLRPAGLGCVPGGDDPFNVAQQKP